MSMMRLPANLLSGFLSSRLVLVLRSCIRLLQRTPKYTSNCMNVLEAAHQGDVSDQALESHHLDAVPQQVVRSSFVTCYLNDVLARGDCVSLRKVGALEPVIVEMLPIVTGRDQLLGLDVRENAGHMPWHQSSYVAYPAATYILEKATVQGAVGITGIEKYVLTESLWHTTPDRHSYEREGENVVLLQRNVEQLSGLHISLLVGAAESYWHSVIDATARLTLVPEEILRSAKSVLLPSTGVAQMELIELYGLPEGVEVRLVAPDESFQVDTLVYPSSIHYLFDYHPNPLNRFYDRVLSHLSLVKGLGPKLIYIDRRSSGLRRLLNETHLVQALEQLGFVAVRLESLSVAEQAVLFREARVIVAPHGAGLTNIGFLSPGSWVIELMMDLYLNWCYRRIAAIRALKYDCIIGRAVHTPGIQIESIHGQPWSIEIDAVVAFVSTRAL